MLVLSRKSGESIVVPDCDITITVVEISRGRVRLGITAPRDTTVLRKEILWQRIEAPLDSVENVPSLEKRHPLPR